MAKLDWNKTKISKQIDNNRLNSDVIPESSKILSPNGSDAHITNLAKKCYNKMIIDPKNINLNPEDIWIKSLTWAKSVINKKR